MFAFLVVLHLIIAILLIGVVLMQSGKGQGLAGAFGMGGSQSLFGGRGAVDFLGKATWVLGGLFLMMSLLLAKIGGGGGGGPRESLIQKQARSAPAVPAPVTSSPSATDPTTTDPTGVNPPGSAPENTPVEVPPSGGAPAPTGGGN